MGRKNSNARPRQKGRRIKVAPCRYYSDMFSVHTAEARQSSMQQSLQAGKVETAMATDNVEKKQRGFLVPHSFEVWFASLGSHYDTSIQSGTRPVLIISNDVANRYSRTVTVIPLTSKRKKLELPTHVMLLTSDCRHYGVQHLSDSVILAEQIITIDKTMLRSRLCFVEGEEKRKEIEQAVITHLGMASIVQPVRTEE